MTRTRTVATVKKNLDTYLKESKLTLITESKGKNPVGILIPLEALEPAQRELLTASMDFNPRHAVSQSLDAVLALPSDD